MDAVKVSSTVRGSKKRYHKLGRDIILTLKEGSGKALFQSCDVDMMFVR